MPSDLVMTPSMPVTPLPAVAGPVTGGQKVAQDPLHFELVGVSGANQYSTKPLELVSTFVPPTVVASKVALLAAEPAPAAAALLTGAAGLLLWAAGLLELAELPQAATVKAIAASPVAPHIFRIRINFPFTVQVVSHLRSRTVGRFRSPAA